MAEQSDLFTDLFAGAGGAPSPRKQSASDVLTFGKHRGQPYEVLLRESAYALWLMSSMPDKLANEHPELWAFLVRRYGIPDRTPAHNKLQNLFLREEFCLRFAHLVSKTVQRWARASDGLVIDVPALWEGHCRKTAESGVPLLWQSPSEDKRKARETGIAKVAQSLEHQARHLKLLDACVREVEGEDCAIAGVTALEFEAQGADVSFRVLHGYELETDEHPKLVQFGHVGYVRLAGQRENDEFRVEVKPVVGDDYPAVLRAMKAVGSKQLLVGEYSGAGATWEEVVKVFSLSKITAVLLSEVETHSLPVGLAPATVVPLSKERAEALARAAWERRAAENA